MEGFKSNPKMKSQLPCFKEGGYVTKKELVAYEKKEDRAEEKKDIAEDKKIVKKAIGQHESAQHKGSEKTEIKLKAGRRVKKEGGVVNKFKKGGAVDAAEKGKPSADKDKIKKVAAKPKKAAAPSKAKTKKPEAPGSEMGSAGAMDMMTAPPAAGPEAAAPSPAMGMMAGPDEYAGGGWINEEPDDMTAPVKRAMKKRRPMPAAAGAVSAAERQQLMNMFQGGPSGMAADGQTFGPRQPITSEGMGQASATGGMGNAAPMGAPSDQERNIMRGLQAIGEYCYGGKV